MHSQDMWHDIEYGLERDGYQIIEGLRGIAKHRLGKEVPEVNMFIAVMISAAKERDTKYLKSESFELHCHVCKLDYEEVCKIFLRVWEKEDEEA